MTYRIRFSRWAMPRLIMIATMALSTLTAHGQLFDDISKNSDGESSDEVARGSWMLQPFVSQNVVFPKVKAGRVAAWAPEYDFSEFDEGYSPSVASASAGFRALRKLTPFLWTGIGATFTRLQARPFYTNPGKTFGLIQEFSASIGPHVLLKQPHAGLLGFQGFVSGGVTLPISSTSDTAGLGYYAEASFGYTFKLSEVATLALNHALSWVHIAGMQGSFVASENRFDAITVRQKDFVLFRNSISIFIILGK